MDVSTEGSVNHDNQPFVEPSSADSVHQPEEKEISPATGEEMKKHEAAGRKGLSKEQHPKYWEQVIYWNKERFAEAKWREVIRRIERATKEDKVIVFGWHPPKPTNTINKETGRPLLPYSFSLTSFTSAHPLLPAHLPRIGTSSTMSRSRVPSAPVTPLSATSGPIKNAFAEGGFWASLSPKTPTTPVPVSSRPITAVPAEPWVPDTPKDVEAKNAYDEVKRDVKKMTLQLCANRLALDRLSNGEYDVIHPSMVKPKDELLAAELTLESRQLDLSKHIDPDLPAKIEGFADDEAVCVRRCIKTVEQLDNVDYWMQYDEITGELTNLLEAQRNLFRLNRDQHKSKCIELSEEALQLAWATKIVSDTEYITASRTEAEGEDSDEDEGYDYSNFVRSLRSKASSILEERSDHKDSGSARSSGSTVGTFGNNNLYDSMTQNVQPQCSQGYSSSPTLPLRSLDPNTPSSTTSSALFLAPPAPPPKEKIIPSHRKNLSIITHPHSLAVSSTASLASSEPLSPEEKGSRHKGPSMDDLSAWADELKKMERKRAEMKLVGVTGSHTSQHSRASSSTSSQKAFSRKGKEKSDRVDGVLHPAFRFPAPSNSTSPDELVIPRRRRNTTRMSVETTASWLCESAARVERGNSSADSNPETRVEDFYGQGEEQDEARDGDDEREDIEEEEEDFSRTPTPTLQSHVEILRPRPLFRLSPPRAPPSV